MSGLEQQWKHLGRLVRRAREAKGLGRYELVKALGYRNLNRGLRRLHELETGHRLVRQFLERLEMTLELDHEQVAGAMDLDKADQHERREAWLAERERWLDQPAPMELIVKWFCGFYTGYPLPEATRRDRSLAEAFASELAKRKRVRVCLMVSRREAVWFGEDGRHDFTAVERKGEQVVPHMSIGGRKARLEIVDGKLEIEPLDDDE